MKSSARLASHSARFTHATGFLTEGLRCLLLQVHTRMHTSFIHVYMYMLIFSNPNPNLYASY